MQYPIEIINQSSIKKYQFIINTWKLKNQKNTEFSLIIKPDRIELKNNIYPKLKNIWINFNYKNFQKYKKDKKIKIIKTIKKKNPYILDVTGGLGRDAFIFFTFGCTVTIIEENPILSILLYDGLYRGFKDPKIGNLLKKKIKLIYNNSMNIESLNIPHPDIIYFDPIFPYKKKTALSKKNIRTIKQLIKKKNNPNNLFYKCINFTKNKIIVKRPKYANYIANIKPNFIIKTKKNRFDVYTVNNN